MFRELATLMRDSVRKPAESVPAILSLGIPREARWLGLAAVVALSGLASAIMLLVYGAPPADASDTAWVTMTGSPIRMAMIQGIGILFVAGAITHIGRIFGGKGQFIDALLLVVWVETVLLVIQYAQLALWLFVFPILPASISLFLSMMTGLLSMVVLFWMLVGIIKGLHGFTSTPAVLLGMVATMFGAGTVLLLVLTVLGIAPVAGV